MTAPLRSGQHALLAAFRYTAVVYRRTSPHSPISPALIMRRLFCALLALCVAAPAYAQNTRAGGTRLLRQPAISKDGVAFIYGGDLWTVGRNGGEARRLTSTPEVESDPVFSPDGSRVAFRRTAGT